MTYDEALQQLRSGGLIDIFPAPAAVLGMSRSHVYRMAKAHRQLAEGIPVLLVGTGRWKVRARDVIAFIGEAETSPATAA